MVDAPYFLKSLTISGFRAFLKPKTFDFSRKHCLAIFAPNGSGKSSVIDALEFFFSEDGTLERLGQRAVNNQAGPAALMHNLSEESKVTPEVTIEAIVGIEFTGGTRLASGAKRPMPAIAATLNTCFAVQPIIRGHELRTFVEIHTPEQRYTDVARWLQLGPLVEVQKNVRLLRTHVKAAAEDQVALKRFDARVAKETTQAVKVWERAAVLGHVNVSILAPLDPALTLIALARNDSAYVELESRAIAEENKVGIAGLRQISRSAAALSQETVDGKSGEASITGAIPTFIAAVTALSRANSKEAEERRISRSVESRGTIFCQWRSGTRCLPGMHYPAR
jgi:ABC-type hemin transport system ATPase subunit